MDAVQDAVGGVTSTVGAGVDSAVAFYNGLPIAEPLAGYYTQFLGDTSTAVFITEIVPILYVTVLPIISLFFAVCGCCKGKKGNVGQRILRRVGHATGRVLSLQKMTRGGKISPSKSPAANKGKAAGKAEEAAIKARAAGNPRRY